MIYISELCNGQYCSTALHILRKLPLRVNLQLVAPLYKSKIKVVNLK